MTNGDAKKKNGDKNYEKHRCQCKILIELMRIFTKHDDVARAWMKFLVLIEGGVILALWSVLQFGSLDPWTRIIIFWAIAVFGIFTAWIILFIIMRIKSWEGFFRRRINDVHKSLFGDFKGKFINEKEEEFGILNESEEEKALGLKGREKVSINWGYHTWMLMILVFIYSIILFVFSAVITYDFISMNRSLKREQKSEISQYELYLGEGQNPSVYGLNRETGNVYKIENDVSHLGTLQSASQNSGTDTDGGRSLQETD